MMYTTQRCHSVLKMDGTSGTHFAMIAKAVRLSWPDAGTLPP
jgi:hypothetical protein